MAKDNSYLASFKISLVRQAMEDHELKAVAQKYGVSKSTLWQPLPTILFSQKFQT